MIIYSSVSFHIGKEVTGRRISSLLALFVLPQVWVGSVTEITTEELSAEDADTPPEGLEFIVTPPSNGHLALKSAPSKHILNFTQNHIQNGQLVFVHSGERSSCFSGDESGVDVGKNDSTFCFIPV